LAEGLEGIEREIANGRTGPLSGNVIETIEVCLRLVRESEDR